MKKPMAIWIVGGALLLALAGIIYVQAQTDCPGDGTNSTVVAEYLFTEGSGTNTVNLGTDGTAGNATLVNGATLTTNAPPQQAGCSGSINLTNTGTSSTTPAVETSGNYDPLAGATNFTLMAWVKRESSSTASNQSARIVSDTSSLTLTSTTAGVEFRFSGSAGTLAMRVNGNELVTTVGGIAPNSNEWHHVAVVYDGTRPATNELTRHAHFYVDGVQRGVGVSNATLNVSVAANTNRLTVGNSAVGRTPGNVLVGKITGVRILSGFAPAAVGNGKTNATILCYINADRDTQTPVITCPDAITVNSDIGQDYATNVSLGQSQVTDNCGVASVTSNAPAQFASGTNTVTWTATDVNGNTNICQQSVTVIDNSNADTDGDGLTDWEEVHVYHTNPLNPDTDGDGLSDGMDPNPLSFTGTGTGLKGEYFDNQDLTNLRFTRLDGQVNFDFGQGSPDRIMATDHFSMSWTGKVQAGYSEAYTFYTVSDDGVRLWVNGQLIISNWTAHAVTTNNATVTLVAGQKYNIKLEYYENVGDAVIKLLWSSPSQPLEVIPTSQLYASLDGWLGLKGEYFGNLVFGNLKMTRVDAKIDFDWGTDPPFLTMGPDGFSIRWTGQFVPPYSETYTFHTLSDDGVRLFVDNRLVIDNWTNHALTENTGAIALIAGRAYDIKLEYYDYSFDAVMKLKWESPSQSLQIVPFNTPLPTDSDGDGISDSDEVNKYGTDSANADTDGDGISDYEELFDALTNPLTNDFNGVVSDVVMKNGSDVSATNGHWQVDATEIYGVDRRGAVEYSMSTSSADIYRLAIDGSEQDTFPTAPSHFDLQVYVDGEYLGRETLEATRQTSGTVHVYTPWLASGTHTVRIFWDNAASFTSLRLKTVRLQSLGGPDQNGNGIKDWIETRLHAMSAIAPALPLTSFVSPACVEGRGDFLSMMTLTASSPGGSTNVTVNHGPGHRWYANVPLTANTNTQIVVSYQNGGLIETGTVVWAAKNILSGSDLTIRKGDSVLFTAAPQGATNGNVTIEIVGVTSYSTTVDAPVAHLFATSGTFTVNGTFDNGSQQTGSITVKVLEHSFASDPDGFVGRTRTWDNFQVPTEAVFDSDLRLLKLTQTSTLTNDGRRMSLLIDQNEARYIVSRVATNGPILAAAQVSGFRLFGAYDTYINVIETYGDGSRLVEVLLILSPVLSDVAVDVEIITSGVTFEDGTGPSKVLTASDFDSLGQHAIRFHVPAAVDTATCHTITVTQNGASVGDY